MLRPIEPARVVLDPGGAPFNLDYGDVYASRDGALAQARHVFLHGSGLPQAWRGREQFVIVETGFGLGVNFLATWHAWRDDAQRPRRLHFVSVERHPVEARALRALAPPELAALSQELAAQWPAPMPGLHRREFEDGAVLLTLGYGDAGSLLPQLVAGADAFFLDGFAPDRNPEAWTLQVMKALARLARDRATVATWCTAHPVREHLAAAGFEITLEAGFGHKRQMLRATFAPRWRVRRHEPPAPLAGERDAIVIGAGLAGASAAFALARRGWTVRVLERSALAGAAASALPWGLLHPQVTADDNFAARLSRAGFFNARAHLERLAPAGHWNDAPLWHAGGAFVQAQDDDQAARWETLAAAMRLAPDFAQVRGAAAMAHELGVAPRTGGWWYAKGASVAAARLCEAWLDHPRITLHRSCPVDRLEWQEGHWIARGAGGESHGSANVCVVAGALAAPGLLGLAFAPVRPVPGRLSLVTAPALSALRATVSGGGTLVPIGDGRFAVGATYEMDGGEAPDTAERTQRAHESNLERLARLLAKPVDATPVGLFTATRCVARDRLPLAGAVADERAIVARASRLRGAHLADLPRVPGLYASFAFGSRGIALAPLAADWIAAQVEGEPWPLERELAGRLDVARFLLGAVRRGRAAVNP